MCHAELGTRRGPLRGGDIWGHPHIDIWGHPHIADIWGQPRSAAHNAVGLAGESPVVGIDCLPTWSYSTLAWGDPVSESSNVNVLLRRASQLAGRNMSSTNLSSG